MTDNCDAHTRFMDVIYGVNIPEQHTAIGMSCQLIFHEQPHLVKKTIHWFMT